MYALAARDAQERVLRADRDPFGIKPLSCYAVRDLAPPGIVDRPMLGFPTPTAQWLRGELAGWAHEILSSSAAGDLINLDFARQMLAQHQSGEADCPQVVDHREFCMWHAALGGFRSCARQRNMEKCRSIEAMETLPAISDRRQHT
jgi:asparagine synthetase B (glutamine-hydrolysing)